MTRNSSHHQHSVYGVGLLAVQAKPASKELFTDAQVEQKIIDALAQREREKAESEQGRFVEIRDAALQAAKREIQAAQEHARALQQAKQELIEQLTAKDEEMRSLDALQTRNQQLEQRVEELEKALENSSANNWGNTFNNQAAKVINLELEKTICYIDVRSRSPKQRTFPERARNCSASNE
ncbi:hypothetical protein OGM63_24620 [Plectonema radiosum NIES-515]|uniref:Uncharacterized protein n=1 Tax=Plectonema radiosum NIES-515 TaxID=2986073 RepID=A0ABT3B5K6_9CYAN|nr:hypothetical protein [Plectonema radiosum]MCV3216648.1 hypothetical protein [Plectonema radiosum NIES-515]